MKNARIWWFKKGKAITLHLDKKALKEDDALYIAYQANIAQAFKDEYSRNKNKYKNKVDIHNIANRAAKNFIDLLISD